MKPSPILRAATLLVVFAGVLLVMGRLVFRPANERPLPPVTFPVSAAVAGWRTIEEPADPLRPHSRRYARGEGAGEVIVEFQFIPDLSVHYIRNPELELRFLPRAHLPLDAAMQHYASIRGVVISNLHESERATSALTPGPGGAGFWTRAQTEHLSAILTPSGDVSISPQAVAHSLYVDHLSLGSIGGWLLGRTALPDPRCVLIHLSTPAGPQAHATLAQAWEAWRAAKRPVFPPRG